MYCLILEKLVEEFFGNTIQVVTLTEIKWLNFGLCEPPKYPKTLLNHVLELCNQLMNMYITRCVPCIL